MFILNSNQDCKDCNCSFENGEEFCAHYNECNRNVGKVKEHKCELCEYKSKRQYDVLRHEKFIHGVRKKNINKHANGSNTLCQEIKKLIMLDVIKELYFLQKKILE